MKLNHKANESWKVTGRNSEGTHSLKKFLQSDVTHVMQL